MPHPKIVDNLSKFNAELAAAGDNLVVVDFFAEWCGPCKTIGPKLTAMSENAEFKGVIFLKVDVDEADDIAGKYEVSAMPTFIFFKNGVQVGKVVGASEVKLKEGIILNM